MKDSEAHEPRVGQEYQARISKLVQPGAADPDGLLLAVCTKIGIKVIKPESAYHAKPKLVWSASSCPLSDAQRAYYG